MFLELEARQFRNLQPLHRSFGVGAHLILGDNGAGKTSLLEAIYLLATTKSFRTARLAECRRHGSHGFHLGAEVEGVVRSRLEIDHGPDGSERRLNGKKGGPLSEHLAVLPVVCWTTGDISMLVGAPEERRRFLDRGVVAAQPTSIAIYTRYRRAMDAKRNLLRQGGSKEEIEPWNALLAEAAGRLIHLRSEYVSRLDVALAGVLETCTLGFPPISVRYKPSPNCGLDGPSAIAEELATVLDRERKLERPLVGPHRDELLILWDGHPIRRVASAGERKALGLALFAAQGQVLSAGGREPLYLLDDADSELDRHRLGSLWKVFGASGQLLATSNRPQIWDGLELSDKWRCADGSIEPL